MKYRVLAPYALQDAIADSVFASYLRSIVDSTLDAHCYAFRLPRTSGPVTHHDAVADLQQFAARHARERLWVAECDIRGFFDSVSHAVTRRRLRALLPDGSKVDRRLGAFVESFLAGYDYREARTKALESLAQRKIKSPKIYDPDEALREARLPIHPRTRIGIPQGSALSSVLANIVLTAADRSVRRTLRNHPGTFYARYVDDIVIASTNRTVAQQAMRAYRGCLRTLELPDHCPEKIDSSDVRARREYWNVKSKSPYSWSTVGKSGIEWIGFLGYQLKRDGTIRPRFSSISKELGKQRRAIDDILRTIDRHRARAKRKRGVHQIPSIGRIRYSAMMHLVSIGVGYPSKPLVWPAPNGVCWASGFRLLRHSKSDVSLLKRLDQGRGRALTVLTARLRSLLLRPGLEETRQQGQRAEFMIARDGRPLSYYGQFVNNPRTLPEQALTGLAADQSP